MKRLRILTLVLVLGTAVPVLPACSRPVTIESVQSDVATNGARLLNATVKIQDAIYASVKAKVITPEVGLARLDDTIKIGEAGQRVAANLIRLDTILQSGQPAPGDLVDRVTSGLTELSKLFPESLVGTTAPQVVEAVQEAQKFIDTLQNTYSKMRSQ